MSEEIIKDEEIEEQFNVEDEMAALDDELEDAQVPEVDMTQYIVLRLLGGEKQYVDAPAPMHILEAITRSRYQVNGPIQIWMDGAEITADTVVPGGKTITLTGNVKGGVS